MPSLKHLVLAFAYVASQYISIANASPTMPCARNESAIPTDVPTSFFRSPQRNLPSATPTSLMSASSSLAAYTGGDGSRGNDGYGQPGPGAGPGPGNQTAPGFPGNGTDKGVPGPDTKNGTESGVFHENHGNHTGPDRPGAPSFPGNRTAPAPEMPPTTLITPAPSATVAAKFVQTTYYSCVTIGPDSHCGWHEPILDAGTSNSGGSVVGCVGAAWYLALGVSLFVACL